MKDRTAAYFLFSVTAVFVVFCFLFEYKDIRLFHQRIRFFSFHDGKEEVHGKDLLKEIRQDSTKSDSVSVPGLSKLLYYPEEPDAALPAYLDSLKKQAYQEISDSSIRESPFLLNIPVKGKYPLDAFFRSLDSLQAGKTGFRAGHYGDSQIEGDRITWTLRSFFQKRFGGIGNGFIPLDDVTEPQGYIRKSSGSWRRHTVAVNLIKNNTFGPGGSAFTYRNDSLAPVVKISFQFPFQTLRLAYGYGKPGSRCQVYDGQSGKLIADTALSSAEDFQFVTISSRSLGSVKLRFLGPSPVIYGLWTDGNSGFQMDNYGLRGQSGDGLMRISSGRLQQMYRLLNMRLAILQFGGNVMPGIRNENILSRYAGIYRDLYLHIFHALEKGSVLVIGVNDLSRSLNGTYKSFNYISEMRYLQRRYAVENGMAFFDLYQFMGGKESISHWNKAGLASRDGHFSDKGRQIVSTELFRALLYEYRAYQKRVNQKG